MNKRKLLSVGVGTLAILGLSACDLVDAEFSSLSSRDSSSADLFSADSLSSERFSSESSSYLSSLDQPRVSKQRPAGTVSVVPSAVAVVPSAVAVVPSAVAVVPSAVQTTVSEVPSAVAAAATTVSAVPTTASAVPSAVAVASATATATATTSASAPHDGQVGHAYGKQTFRPNYAQFDAVLMQKLIDLATHNDSTIDQKRDYLYQTYHFPREQAKYRNGVIVFPNPGHAWNPTHFHPMEVPADRVRIPKVTNDPETDFANELIATAMLTGLSPYQMKFHDDVFLIPHKDHSHEIKMRNPEGARLYLQNRLKPIEGEYLPGEFKKEEVLAQVADIAKLAEDKYGAADIRTRRVYDALNRFVDNLNIQPDNSTAGYKKMLENFTNTEILGKSAAPAETPVSKLYNAIADKIKDADLTGYTVKNADLLKLAQDAAAKQDLAALQAAVDHINEILDTTHQTPYALVKLLNDLISAVDNPHLSQETRENVADLSTQLYKLITRGGTDDAKALIVRAIEAKHAIAAETAGNPTNPLTGGKAYQTLADESLRPKISGFLQGVASTAGIANPYTYNDPTATSTPVAAPSSSKDRAAVLDKFDEIADKLGTLSDADMDKYGNQLQALRDLSHKPNPDYSALLQLANELDAAVTKASQPVATTSATPVPTTSAAASTTSSAAPVVTTSAVASTTSSVAAEPTTSAAASTTAPAVASTSAEPTTATTSSSTAEPTTSVAASTTAEPSTSVVASTTSSAAPVVTTSVAASTTAEPTTSVVASTTSAAAPAVTTSAAASTTSSVAAEPTTSTVASTTAEPSTAATTAAPATTTAAAATTAAATTTAEPSTAATTAAPATTTAATTTAPTTTTAAATTSAEPTTSTVASTTAEPTTAAATTTAATTTAPTTATATTTPAVTTTAAATTTPAATQTPAAPTTTSAAAPAATTGETPSTTADSGTTAATTTVATTTPATTTAATTTPATTTAATTTPAAPPADPEEQKLEVYGKIDELRDAISDIDDGDTQEKLQAEVDKIEAAMHKDNPDYAALLKQAEELSKKIKEVIAAQGSES